MPLRNPRPPRSWTRRQFVKLTGSAILAAPGLNLACGGGSGSSSPPPPITDDEFLDQMERACFQFFWEQASSSSGQIKDRSRSNGVDSTTVSSIASTGFGLTALCIADQRGYLASNVIQARVLATLNFLLQMPNQNGFFYHFIDMDSGQRVWSSEVSPIDTSILLCGILTCRQHFQDPQIQDIATQIYQRVDWPWMLNGGTTLALDWTPENGFNPGRWDTYSELMMMVLLAIGSTTHPIPASCWDQIVRPTLTYQGLTYITGTAPLFIHQYSHAWFDFRNQRDAYANYFTNSGIATHAHKLFCLSLASQFADYADQFWGITASDSVGGYVVWGGPPLLGPVDGSVVPCAAAGSIPFLAPDCIQALRNLRDKYPLAWDKYGFVDAFNPLSDWYDQDVIGIDLGISLLMAENYRTGFVWKTFMKNPEAQQAMAAVGFH